MSSSQSQFDTVWKEKFPQDDPPSLNCLETKPTNFYQNTNEEQAKENYRKALKGALDYHSIRINDLEIKLSKEQFIVEYLAKEIEGLPVPRQSQSNPSPASNGTFRPKPKPRAPPPIMKKPNPPPRSDSPELTVGGVIKRNKSTPAYPAKPLIDAVSNNGNHRPRSYIPTALTQNTIPENSNNLVEIQGSKPSIALSPVVQSDDSGHRFNSFKGGSSDCSLNEEPGNTLAVSAPGMSLDRGSPLVISGMDQESAQPSDKRSSMKKIERISMDDERSTSSDENESSDYMQLWISPQLNIDGTRVDPKSDIPEQTGTDPIQMALEPESANSSAASLSSGRGSSKRSRMVLVNYGGKDLPLTEEPLNDDGDPLTDSDLEDDQPQYVRLMHRAYSNAGLLNRNDSASSHSTDSQDFSDKPDGITKTESPLFNIQVTDRFPLQSMSSEDEVITYKMRQSLIQSILKSETDYIGDLDVLTKYKRSLESAATSSKPLISAEDINIIFGNIHELAELHTRFRSDLAPIVGTWNDQSSVAYLFKGKADHLNLYQSYLSNYPKSVESVQRCCRENAIFNDLVSKIKCPSTQEQQHLTEILHKPINRMQRNSLDLQEFIKVTPVSHPDYNVLQKALSVSQSFLDNIKVEPSSGVQKPLHVLVKNQLLVQYVGSKARKLRHVLLFHNMIICTKVLRVKNRYEYQLKWFILLNDLDFSDKVDDTPVEWKQKVKKAEKEIKQMKDKLKELKAQLKRELKECRDKQINPDTYKVQRLTRNIQEQEGNLLLAEPRLRLTLKSTRSPHQHVFLMSTDYERREWLESIKALKSKLPKSERNITVSNEEVQSIIDVSKQHVQFNSMGNRVITEAGEKIIDGQIKVTIHKMDGLQMACDTMATMEVDSFGHFYTKAKTPVQKNTDRPVWNESFEIDLESSTTLRLMCYQKMSNEDRLLGMSKLELDSQWLREGFENKEISMKEVTVTISIKYKTTEQTICRSLSTFPVDNLSSGIFGVSISSTCNKEKTTIPVFVSACIEDVEKRGLDELGIYRVSGSTSDVQRIKRAFDKNARAGKLVLQDVEINAVTGALKLYFRELPESLFTDSMYDPLIKAFTIQDPVEREKKMISILASLPDPNYHTIIAVLNHLNVIGEHESLNKMSFYNLAVVFGPTLLKPARRDEPTNPMDLFSSSANDAQYQSRILFFYLELVKRGVTFRPSR